VNESRRHIQIGDFAPFTYAALVRVFRRSPSSSPAEVTPCRAGPDSLPLDTGYRRRDNRRHDFAGRARGLVTVAGGDTMKWSHPAFVVSMAMLALLITLFAFGDDPAEPTDCVSPEWFVTIAASDSYVYGLDGNGRVWQHYKTADACWELLK